MQRVRIYLIALLVLLILGLCGYSVLRTALLKNAQSMGSSLARSYASEEKSNLSVYEILLNFGVQNLEEGLSEGWGNEEISAWILRYFRYLEEVLGEGCSDPYVAVENEIIAANPWDGDTDYDFTGTQWYQDAVKAQGNVIFTDVYTDAIYDRSVITIAQACTNSEEKAVLAIDIFPEKLKFQENQPNLPEGMSLYVCDKEGIMVYSQTILHYSQEVIQGYVQKLVKEIKEGNVEVYDAYVYDLEGSQRNVYYDVMSNGWYVIVTIPYETLLKELNRFTLVFVGIFLLCIIGVVTAAYRDMRLNSQMDRTNETVRVLGNSYYALYRINYESSTYEMIKGSDYVRCRIPPTGPYEELLRILEELVEEDTYQEFLSCFSTESIRRLVLERVRDFGGDFRRLFGDTYRWVNVRVLFDESLAKEEVVLCFKEVDAEKQRQFQERKLLENALENARRSEKTKHAFFNNMSHDMRTPLNAIIGLSELVKQHINEPEKVLGYTDKINYSSRQLLALVNDILDMSRMEQGKVVLNQQQFNLRECIEECGAAFRLQAEAENKKFWLEYDIKNSMVVGDPFRIGQIMNNLLSNAFKFTEEGDSVSVHVRQFEDKEYSQYQIIVKDTGIGMSEEFIPHLFEPYARETKFSSRQITGTGLGMPIVKNLITQMSGQIHVESRPGEGSTFTISVPFTTVKDKETAKIQEKEQGEYKGIPLKGKKILLAEDNMVNMEIASEILSMNGIEVVQAWNGAEAVELFKASKAFAFDAVLMDMQMPQMDGCEAARHIRALSRPDAQTIPIIAVTANAFAEDIAATTAAGMDAHISKPIDFRVLCQTLEELMNQKKA